MGLGFYLGYFAAISYINKLLHPTSKRYTPQYKVDKEEEIVSFEKRIPIIFGFNKVKGHIIYREETDDAAFDLLVGFGEGEVKSIESVKINNVPIAELLDSTLAIPYRGFANQTADNTLLEGVFKVSPIADAYVCEIDKRTGAAASDTNYGTAPILYGGRISSNYYEAFFKFDLSGLPDIDTVNEVNLVLYGLDSQSQSNKGEMQAFTIAAGDEGWTETGLTWNNKKAVVHACDTTEPKQTANGSYQVFNVDEADAKAVVVAAIGVRTCTLVVKQNGVLNVFGGYASKESEHPIATLNIHYTATKPCGLHNTAYVAINLDTSNDKIGNYIPEVTAKIEGINHLWNAGTSVYEYNKNPIWEIRYLLTNTRAGLNFSETEINDTSFIAAATYCDGTVTTAEGIEEARYECNIVIDTAQSTWNHIQEILATCAGYLYMVDGEIHIKVERDETFDGNTQTFDITNIIEGTFAYSEEEQENVPNSISVRYTDPNRDFKEIPVQIDDDYDISLRGKISFEVPLYGVNRRSQASRLARFILLKKQLNKIKARFRISVNNCWISLGDVCYITHAVAGWTNKKFRVIQLSEFLNEEIELYCEEYDELVYVDDTGKISFNEITVIPYKYTIPPITSLTLTEVYSDFQKPFQAQINIAFTEPTMINPFGSWVYEIWVSPDNDTSYVYEISTTTSPVVISVTDIGTYYVKIKTRRDTEVSSAMLLADAPEDSITIVGEAGDTPAPPALSGFEWTTGVAPKRAIWTTGAIVYEGKAYAINSGSTSNAYIYFKPATSETVLQTSASRPTIEIDSWIMAYFNESDNIITLAEGGRLIHAGLLQANTITANEIEAGTITATEITVATLSAITADMGSLTAGQIVITKNSDKIWLNDANDGAINLGGNDKANSLIRFNADGSGYVADGKISWTTAGVITLTGTGAAGIAGSFANSGTITGGVIQTASSGQRIVMSGSDNTIRFHTATAANCIIIDDNISALGRPGIQIEDSTNGGLVYIKKDISNRLFLRDSRILLQTTASTNPLLTMTSNTNDSTNAVILAIKGSGLTGNLFEGKEGATSVFQIDETGAAYFAGNVGIGTSSPDVNLEIENSSDGATVGITSGGASKPNKLIIGKSVTDGVRTEIVNNPRGLGAVDIINYYSGSNADMNFGVGGVIKMTIEKSAGNVGIGTTDPTQPLSIAEKSGHTLIGGLVVKLTNKTGGSTVQGQLVTVYSATAVDDAFKVIATNDDATFGVVFETGIADGSEAWIVVSGIAAVLMDAGGSVRGDRIISSGNIAGSADVWNVGGAVDTHFQEIGHCLESIGGIGLARCALHFN